MLYYNAQLFFLFACTTANSSGARFNAKFRGFNYVPMFEKQTFIRSRILEMSHEHVPEAASWEDDKKTYCTLKIHWRYTKASTSSEGMYWRPYCIYWRLYSYLLLSASTDRLKRPIPALFKIFLFKKQQTEPKEFTRCLPDTWVSGLVQEQFTSVGMIALSIHFK